ncbi:hypothetical protein ABZS37_13855, partial [Micromonospora sp. NPDC005413]
MLRRRGMALVGTLGLVGAVVAVIPAAAGESAAGKPMAGLAWVACPEDVVVPPTVQLPLQCAKVPVPLDYGDPGGAQIELMVSRIASTKPEKRRGVLMLNPGGPGGT